MVNIDLYKRQFTKQGIVIEDKTNPEKYFNEFPPNEIFKASI